MGVDVSLWNSLLQTYVASGQVDYASWQKEATDRLERWLVDASTVDIEQLGQDHSLVNPTHEPIAFLLNLYNALTIQQVLKKYPIKSIRPKLFGGVPNWASFLLFFKKEIYALNGQSLSLDNIEQGILRKQYSEPRIHFALVCASEGCPLIRGEAYEPQTLEAQLEDDVYRFINNPDKVRYDAATNTLYCSMIFKWYEEDFIEQEASIAAYIQRYLRDVRLSDAVAIEYLPYSWQLNQRTSS